jgi:hypothetical protein
VCGLAELQIDPYFRTKRGFAILIEKEWLSYGHKFEERIGHRGRGEKDKERSPIFFQWLECVYQRTLRVSLVVSCACRVRLY